MERKIKNILLEQIVPVAVSADHHENRKNSFSRSGNPNNKPASSAIFSQGSIDAHMDSIVLD